ncbi:putative Mg2+-dependent phosphodiesterase TTRAP [Handroanthus impetiginosus]|uniref:Putative Mg2+-dependent phosphodiesterase TTRAP n=1 Tax=Handroanthus impetiginosus TaxID=429701 RepID=A0A2G9HYX3_9LAMI|nr:putative Mg2+-dependent phosphodiesterase TTRAP [Handroanthus impetiginosus]
MISISKPYRVTFFIFPFRIPSTYRKTLSSLTKMSSWACSKCTFINRLAQKITLRNLSLRTTTPPIFIWSCVQCTFLNPYRSTICEICGGRASASPLSGQASPLSGLQVDGGDFDEAQLGSSLFLPLRACTNTKTGNSDHPHLIHNDTGFSVKFKGVLSPLPDYGKSGNRENQYVGDGGSGEYDSEGNESSAAALQPSRNKRKYRNDTGVDGGGGDAGGSSRFMAVKAANKTVEFKSLDEMQSGSKSKTWKILSYNVWFREDLEMHNRMKALGSLIELHEPDVICFQEVTSSFYDIFQQSSWWKRYHCSISNEDAIPGAYFCMQLCKLPIKSYSSKPFRNSIMGRELCVAEIEVQPGTLMVVATSHLESPCPSPPTWDQMFSKERVAQANEAVRFLDRNLNVIFCGDMNWDDELDGPFPLPDEWLDAWTQLKPGEVGWTYDTKSNKMLSGNRPLQKRLDRFVCKLKDFKIHEIQMIGTDAIPGLTYVKEKRVKGQVKELELPVLPSDHYGLLLTICPGDSTLYLVFHHDTFINIFPFLP